MDNKNYTTIEISADDLREGQYFKVDDVKAGTVTKVMGGGAYEVTWRPRAQRKARKVHHVNTPAKYGNGLLFAVDIMDAVNAAYN
jgi:hypothetical protein